MKFSTASLVEQVVWSMKLADIPRGENRKLINDLSNGLPPYTDDEVRENGIQVNANFLELTKILHDARRQFFNAFLNGGTFFSVNLDYGPVEKRREWSRIITREINHALKRSMPYFEGQRSTHAALVSHGIGPKVWFDTERWRPTAVGIEDVMIPSGTLLTMENLPFFAVSVQYTAAELYRLTHGPRPDPGWNMDMVDRALKWADGEWRQEISYAETFSPEKSAERFKQDLGLYASDAVPTIDTWHFFFWNDDKRRSGWNKKIILDTPAPHETGSFQPRKRYATESDKSIIGSRGEFLFDPGSRKYADSLSQIIHWQFGDASAVGPFRYHSVRSLGFLLYAVCHLQNRLRCRFNEATFEALLQYFRVNNPNDAERMTKFELVNKGIIPTGVEFVKAEERWNVNEGLVEQAMAHNRQTMQDNSVSYTQDVDFQRERERTTATEVMAKVNAANALVSSMLSQAYRYAEWEYREICRRFCIPNSKDPDVRKFRKQVLHQGVDEEALNSDCWQVEAERVLGGGNKVLQFAQVDKLMSAYAMFDPEPQREILNTAVAVWTDDDAYADHIAPVGKKVISDSVHDAQLATGTLMLGLPVTLKTGMNHIEYVETLLFNMGMILQRIEAKGGMATMEEIVGLQNMLQHTAQHVQIIAQNPEEKARVRQYEGDMTQIGNLLKGYAQRLQEAQAQQVQAGNGGIAPEDEAKLQGMMLINQAKAANLRESHGQRTAQRQIQWQMEEKRKQEEHQLEMARQVQDQQVGIAATDMETAAEIRRKGMEASQEKPSQEGE